MTDEKNIIPTNIKQIGSIGDGVKVYVEDYAGTYSMQYSAAENCKEKAAVLVGRYEKDEEGEEVIFVSGVIQGKYAVRRNGITELTDKSWQYISKQMELYFKDCEIVGWMYVQPGFEDYINDSLCAFQIKNMQRGLKLLYLSDPQEDINSFYLWDETGNVFTLLKGYLIYYDKNEGMHEYMLENKLKPVNTHPELEMSERDDAGAKARRAASKTVRKTSKNPPGSRLSAEQKKMVNLLGAASFVMLVVCMVMGAGLIQNGERLSDIEGRLNQLQADFDGTKSVFAAQVEPTTVQTTAQQTVQQTTQTQAVQTTREAQTAQAVQSEPETYVVESGDTLIKISQKFYGTDEKVDEISALNGIEESKIVAGATLRLP